MLPAARKGAAKTGRDFAKFEMAAMPLIATAPDRARLEARVRDVRARIAFYASTPTYLIAFESAGLRRGRPHPAKLFAGAALGGDAGVHRRRDARLLCRDRHL